MRRLWSVSVGEGVSVGGDVDLFNFQGILHAHKPIQNMEGRKKKEKKNIIDLI